MLTTTTGGVYIKVQLSTSVRQLFKYNNKHDKRLSYVPTAKRKPLGYDFPSHLKQMLSNELSTTVQPGRLVLKSSNGTQYFFHSLKIKLGLQWKPKHTRFFIIYDKEKKKKKHKILTFEKLEPVNVFAWKMTQNSCQLIFCWPTNQLIVIVSALGKTNVRWDWHQKNRYRHSRCCVPTVLTFVEKSIIRNADRMQMRVPWASVMWCTVWPCGILSMLAEADHPLRKRCPEILFHRAQRIHTHSCIHFLLRIL